MQSVSIKYLDFLDLESIRPLTELHYQEITTDKEIKKLSPHLSIYEAMAENKNMICLYAYSGDRCIGYSINFVYPLLHYRETISVENDLIFVHPDFRGEKIGELLIKETEKKAIEAGAHLILWHAKDGSKLDSMFKDNGYKVQDVIYGRAL